MKYISILLVALFVLAACGSGGSDVNEPTPTTSAGDPEITVPTGNAINPQPVTEARVISTEGNEVRFGVEMGVEPCDVIDRVEVTETDTSVDVRIFRGVGDIAATCIAIAVERIVVAELDAPLGDRALTLSGVEIAS